MRRAASTLTFPFTSTFAFTFALALAFPSAAHAFGAGVFGFSGKPPAQSCTMCHSGGAAPQVTLSGPSALAAGQTATYTIDIVTGASTAHAGFDIATSAGALATIAQTNESWLNSGEITHTRNWPKGSTIQLMFQLTAPAAPGPLTIFATALDSDGVDDTGGDGAASTTFAVDVQAPPDLAGADFAGAPLPDLAQVDAVSSATEFSDTRHYLAPVLGWHVTGRSTLKVSTGFGVTSASDRYLVRAGWAYEFSTAGGR